MVSPETIEEAGRLLAEAARPPARILLFGSHARGSASTDSDLDLLVIEPVAGSRHREMVRLRAALDPLRVPADVVVVTGGHVEAWGAVPGTLIHAALSKGRVLAET
jgi:predicted nucleotidyltransferase